MPIRRLRTLILLACGVGVLPALPGCWTHTPARRASEADPAPLAIPDDAWRPRDVEVLRPILEATPMQVHRYQPKPGIAESELSPEERLTVAEVSETLTYKGIHGRCLLRVIDRPFRPKPLRDNTGTYRPSVERLHLSDDLGDALEERFYGFIPNARTLSSRTIQNERLREALLDDREQRAADRASLLGSRRVEATGITVETFLYAGIPIRIPPAIAGAPRPRGLIIHLHAISGNGYEPRVMEEFARRGWAIVDFQTQTFVDTPLSPEQKAREKELLERKRDIQHNFARIIAQPATIESGEAMVANSSQLFMTLSELQSLRRRAAYQACPGTDLDPVAANIATEVDEAMSGAAYAVEAVLDYIRTQRPDLPTRPLALMGFSAGALATPTVAARLGDQVDAAIIIGGGANVLRLSQESALTDGGLRVRCGEKKIDRPTLDRLAELYLKHSRLDPYHTAPLLAARGTPLLQVHANDDTWVPASGGELLYQRLGRPERLTIHADHDLLFYFLPEQASRLADWLDKTLPATAR